MAAPLRGSARATSIRRLLAAIALAFAALFFTPGSALAHVVRVVIDKRETIANGVSFGTAGAYERLTGRVFFAFDPANPHDRQIVDLSRAPRNVQGEVEAWAEFVMLRPVDASRGSGVTLVDAVNRGMMTVGVFHLGANRELSPDSAAYYGDALLLRRGVTVVMLGWQWDILPDAAGMHFHPPVAGDASHSITGLVRSDITVDAPTHTIPLGHVVGASLALAYPVSDTGDAKNQLTVRDAPLAPRRRIPRAQWRFAREDSSGAVIADPRSVYMDAGFEAGKIYEVVYRAKDPVVAGTGLAAVRDMISYLKYDSSSIAPTHYGIAYGVSQTGRFLRHFLYQDFNVDERGRRAFDGIFAHTAGAGRGSFNHRFAQPSRDAQPYSTFFYPTDLFPFTTVDESDPVTGRHGGLRVHNRGTTGDALAPKVFYVDGGYEYWGRAASLSHTTVNGAHDVGFLSSERRYVISSAQHSSPARFPPAENAHFEVGPAFRGDPLDQRLALRALLIALIEWVKDDRTPPASLYPTIAGGSLVPVDSSRRPTIPGVAIAKIAYQPYRYDFGSRWSAGIIDREPPGIGAPYVVRVPQVDSLGNDLGGIRSVEARVPLATYFPWSLRTGTSPDRLMSFVGTFVPLPRTEAGRASAHDPRPSVERLYGGRDAFLSRVNAAAAELVAQRFMLAEDTSAARARMAATWDWLSALPAR
ncbi:MAG: alpha/beta hydrolase domain-containing protein [Gemmatimonadota bacterium]|nr:alpha/beta hydrolase domain-containing protein [Gemmatimonadota bacterium]